MIPLINRGTSSESNRQSHSTNPVISAIAYAFDQISDVFSKTDIPESEDDKKRKDIALLIDELRKGKLFPLPTPESVQITQRIEFLFQTQPIEENGSNSKAEAPLPLPPPRLPPLPPAPPSNTAQKKSPTLPEAESLLRFPFFTSSFSRTPPLPSAPTPPGDTTSSSVQLQYDEYTQFIQSCDPFPLSYDAATLNQMRTLEKLRKLNLSNPSLSSEEKGKLCVRQAQILLSQGCIEGALCAVELGSDLEDIPVELHFALMSLSLILRAKTGWITKERIEMLPFQLCLGLLPRKERVLELMIDVLRQSRGHPQKDQLVTNASEFFLQTFKNKELRYETETLRDFYKEICLCMTAGGKIMTAIQTAKIAFSPTFNGEPLTSTQMGPVQMYQFFQKAEQEARQQGDQHLANKLVRVLNLLNGEKLKI